MSGRSIPPSQRESTRLLPAAVPGRRAGCRKIDAGSNPPPSRARSRMNSIAADAPVAPPQPSPIELEVQRIRELATRRRHAEALAAAEALAVQVPENRDVLYLIALCERHCNRIAPALATLERLEQLHPRFSRLLPGARPLLRRPARCAARDRRLPARREHQSGAAGELAMLEGLYRMTGDAENAATAAAARRHAEAPAARGRAGHVACFPTANCRPRRT